MVDNTENILVDFDYNNIIIVDPNKVIDENGKSKERYVSQENLVMYANLECKLLPRTKLAIGAAYNDSIQTVSVASINFLKPGGKTFLDNSWTDELTGFNTLKGEGVNQPNQNSITNPNKSNDFYIRQTIFSNGKEGATDNGLLGITNINIRQGLDFLPTFEIKLIDVKGRALFEGGNSSPYAAFFNMPYPPFTLTIKGYYGKAVKYTLYMRTFNATYDMSTGNFHLDLTFYTYKYSVIAEVQMQYLLAVPNMYKSIYSVKPQIGGGSNFTEVKDELTSGGYEKIKEVYSEYKTKGLIPQDFPEMTLMGLRYKIENFVTNTLNSFVKTNTDPLTHINEYRTQLTEFKKVVYLYEASNSWFDKYMDKVNYLVIDNPNVGGSVTEVLKTLSNPSDNTKTPTNKNRKIKVYTFKPEIKAQDRVNSLTSLNEIIIKYKNILTSNVTLGINGSYSANGKKVVSEIPFTINNIDIFNIQFILDDVDVLETYRQVTGKKEIPETTELEKFKTEIITNKIKNQKFTNKDGNLEQKNEWFYFEGDNSFMDRIEKMGKSLNSWKEKIENDLTESLSNLLKNTDSGIGFAPTIRNVLSVVFANGEAFLRLLDDTHKTAWVERDNLERKRPIFKNQTSNANPDNISSGSNEKLPVYPWPTYMVSTDGENGHEKFELRYPGDDNIVGETNGFNFDVWPEIEFVEEFLRGFTDRTSEPKINQPKFNEVTNSKRISLNAIEFPITNTVYENKEEVKFFYEIFERIFYISNYSRLTRSDGFSANEDKMAELISESEILNINESLSNENPFLIKKLKEYGINDSNFITILKHISNQGVGNSWQNYIRGIFNTPYIKSQTENSPFTFITSDIIESEISKPLISLSKEKDLIEYISNSTTSNNFDILDTYPFIDSNWCKNNLSDSGSFSSSITAFNTNKVLKFNTTLKAITNFNGDKIYPVSNFIYKNVTTPTPEKSPNLTDFYNSRTPDKQIVTEGNLNYLNYSGNVTANQTVSMLNTPYFINSIQEGVSKFRNYDTNPFVSSAYLFLNSLPLSTLREKYKKYDNNITTDLDYIFATIKKFGALHNVPYVWVLKLGSIWYRYKKYIETGNDILDNVWKDFDYVTNFDPVTSAKTKDYVLTVNGGNVDIILEQNTTLGTYSSTLINTGFYPKLINDFNVFYQGFQVFTGYTSTDLQYGIDTFGVDLKFAPDSLIQKSKGFDDKNTNRTLSIIPWSVYVNSTDGANIFTLPSMGSTINQTNNECFKNGLITKEVSGNTSMYNGSVRLFWSLPNYGYYDNNLVVKSTPLQHLKRIVSGGTQENFSINGYSKDYSDISEIFSVFEKEVLDLFETKFLDFTKSKYDSDPSTESSFGTNFQNLMIDLMKVGKQTGNTQTEIIQNIQNTQLSNINSLISKFIDKTLVIKYGNPSSFDKKLFYTFSNYDIVDPYTWEFYQILTPNALPYNGGGISLSISKANYPNEWKTLETYIGFSNINELKYSDNGSFITDFFIDFNIAFTIDNIKNLTPIIKVYATQKLSDIINNTAAPNTVTDKPSSATLFGGEVAEIILSPGVKRTPILRSSNGSVIRVSNSVSNILISDKNLLEKIVIEQYGDLTTNEIVSIYERPKKLTTSTNPKSNFNKENFKRLIDTYINNTIVFQGRIVNNVMIGLQSKLANVNFTPQRKINSATTGNVAKLDLWQSFKSINDKWIAGTDFSTKTLFEDVLFLDRASRNIGDYVLVDIFKLKSRIENLYKYPSNIDMYAFVAAILTENNFQYSNIPGYVNFYNVQDAVKNSNPRSEGSSEFANTLFGTYMNVDTRQSSSKMVCTYISNKSDTLAINNVDFKFRDDAFDLRKASDNPLMDNLQNKKDWDKSNKVVGFNVDIGTQNQSIFNGFKVSQNSGKPTAESLEVETMMANVASGKQYATQTVSLYNLYKNRSYTCDITMMGNALIQPLMYFNLRYVPMFHGPYMITNVNHSISPGSFVTSIQGVRQPTASLPKIDDFLQSIKANLLTTIVENSKQNSKTELTKEQKEVKNTPNVINQNNSTTAMASNNKILEVSNTCSNLLNSKYVSYVGDNTPDLFEVNVADVTNKIMSRMTALNITDDNKLKYVVFSALYVFSSTKNGTLEGYGYNFSGVKLDNAWNSGAKFKSEYYCYNDSKNNLPYAIFNSLEDNIDLLLNRWKLRMGDVSDLTPETIAKFWFINKDSIKLTDTAYEIYKKNNKTELINIENKIKVGLQQFNANLRL